MSGSATDGAVHVVLPGDVDDPTRPSGGNVYDRRVCDGMAAAGRKVHEHAIAGSWPRPDATARAELARVLAAAPDGALVLLDGLVACGVPDVVVPQAHRLRLAVLVHLPLGDEHGQQPGHAAVLDARERETLRAVGTVVATSDWTAHRLVAHHALSAHRVHVVTPGVDPAPLATGTDGATGLLCVGSVTPTKGQDQLVEALAAVADLPWHCECVGPLGRDRAFVEALRHRIAHHGLDGRVRLAGPRTGAPLADAYAAADLVVLPSRTESYGMVVTEALARGVPVLAAAVDGVPQTVGRTADGRVPGLLVPPAGLAAALRCWLGDDDLRRTLRDAAAERRGTLPGWEVTSRCLADALEPVRA